MQSLHQSYEDWLINKTSGPLPAPVLIMDADQGIDNMIRTYETYKEEIRDKSAIIFRNYDSKECAEICRDSPGCESFLYRQDMKWGNKKDEENGCFLCISILNQINI